MAELEIVALDPKDAEAYWSVYIAGRTDVPTTDVRAHVERYESLPDEERAKYFAATLDGALIGCFRAAPGSIGSFAVLPAWEHHGSAILNGALRVARTGRVEASYEDRYAGVFAGAGFRELFSRVRMEAPIGRNCFAPPEPLHAVTRDRLEEVVDLLIAAYEGHMEQSFGMHVGSRDDWIGYVRAIFDGEVGRYLANASFVSESDGTIHAAILNTHWMGSPLIADLGVRPDARRRGLGKALVLRTMNALSHMGEDKLALYVTLGNEPAIRLYDRLGFRVVGGRSVSGVLG